jgi:hypothetical protein
MTDILCEMEFPLGKPWLAAICSERFIAGTVVQTGWVCSMLRLPETSLV